MTDLGLPRTSRLLRSGEFRNVFTNPECRVSCRYFLALAVLNGAESARMGLVVSKKNVRGAVARNRVKRLIRERFRNRREQLAGADLIILARKNAETLENPAIHRRLDGLCDNLQRKLRRFRAENRRQPSDS